MTSRRKRQSRNKRHKQLKKSKSKKFFEVKSGSGMICKKNSRSRDQGICKNKKKLWCRYNNGKYWCKKIK